MWWLAVSGIVGLGKLIYDAATETPAQGPAAWTTERTAAPATTLVKNLRALRELTREPDPGRIAFLGQPGAGKSSMITQLSKGRARPAPVVGVETDATSWAERDDVDLLCQWGKRVASDVPGYDTSTHPVSSFVDHFPFEQFGKICLVLHGKVRASDVSVYHAVCASGVPFVVIRGRAESLDEHERDSAQRDLCARLPGLKPSSIVFLSNRTGEGFDRLQRKLRVAKPPV